MTLYLLNTTLAYSGGRLGNASGQPLLIGNANAGCAPFYGSIQNVRLYNRCLSAQEILAIFNAGNSGMCVPGALPVVTTGAASSITTNSATLNGSVNPEGSTTTIYFQYGQTTNYDSHTSSTNIGTTSGNYGISISGLSANTTYHYQLVAYNGTGTNCGGDTNFTTLGPLPTVTTVNVGPASVGNLAMSIQGSGFGTASAFNPDFPNKLHMTKLLTYNKAA